VLGAYPELEGGVSSELAVLARDWIAAGAQIVGGCCGARPSHIRELRATLDAAPIVRVQNG
jgi:S-methylmethionine-dependent homocysteine/selenocysteine methylase